MISGERDGGLGDVPNLTNPERGEKGSQFCGRRGRPSPRGRFVYCTRPPHSRLTLHVGGYGGGICAVWSDEEGTAK